MCIIIETAGIHSPGGTAVFIDPRRTGIYGMCKVEGRSIIFLKCIHKLNSDIQLMFIIETSLCRKLEIDVKLLLILDRSQTILEISLKCIPIFISKTLV